jgi:hypothetical protein
MAVTLMVGHVKSWNIAHPSVSGLQMFMELDTCGTLNCDWPFVKAANILRHSMEVRHESIERRVSFVVAAVAINLLKNTQLISIILLGKAEL